MTHFFEWRAKFPGRSTKLERLKLCLSHVEDTVQCLSVVEQQKYGQEWTVFEANPSREIQFGA